MYEMLEIYYKTADIRRALLSTLKHLKSPNVDGKRDNFYENPT